MVRAKFKVEAIKFVNAWVKGVTVIAKEIEMWPVCGKEGENSVFGEATPSGNIKMTIVPEDASSQFEMNKEYYVDFTPTKQK